MNNLEQTIREAIADGEIITVIYHGGSEPGRSRQIAPISLKDNIVMARCIVTHHVKSFSLDKLELTGAEPDYLGDYSKAHPHDRKIKPINLNDIPPTCELSEQNIRKIASEFIPPRKKFTLPRIAFFGYFKYLSMTDKRHICKYLGFEYMEDIPFATSNEDQMSLLKSKLQQITDYTALIVIGEDYAYADFYSELYRRYKSKKLETEPRQPIIFERNISVIMESTLIKIHPDYPNIGASTCWRGLNDPEFLQTIS